MEKEKCNHAYRPIIKKVQEWLDKYEGLDGGYKYSTLNQEEVYIYCVNCGDSKRID